MKRYRKVKERVQTEVWKRRNKDYTVIARREKQGHHEAKILHPTCHPGTLAYIHTCSTEKDGHQKICMYAAHYRYIWIHISIHVDDLPNTYVSMHINTHLYYVNTYITMLYPYAKICTYVHTNLQAYVCGVSKWVLKKND